jgi:hypothetical protein
MSDFLNKANDTLDGPKVDPLLEQAEAIAGAEGGAVAGNADDAIDRIQDTED